MQALPIHIHIFWEHNQASSSALKYAELIYGVFNRNPLDPMDRTIGIPCFMHPIPPEDNEVRKVVPALSIYIVLVDDAMLASGEWLSFLEALNSSQVELVPIALSKSVFSRGNLELKRVQFSRDLIYEDSNRDQRFLINIIHHLCKILYADSEQYAKKSLKLFLSHTKADDADFSGGLRKRISNFNDLDSFLDTYDIPIGSYFDQAIESAIQDSILVVHLTDAFSASDLGQRELIVAKTSFRPIIVVNRMKQGAQRFSPYVGNVQHLLAPPQSKANQGNNEHTYDLIIFGALMEAMRTRYIKRIGHLKGNQSQLKPDYILAYPPSLEVLTTLNNKHSEGSITIVYPDPPLGNLENEYLNQVFPGRFNFLTPTLMINEDHNQRSLKVSLSVSESDVGDYNWIDNRRVEDFVVELTRYLLVSGHQLVYSGSLDYELKAEGEEKVFNYARLLNQLLETYQKDYKLTASADRTLLYNYSAFPFSEKVSARIKEKLSDLVQFLPLPPPARLKLEATHADYLLSNSEKFDARFVLAQCLEDLRKKTLDAADVHIAFAGKWKNFKGKMPGVLEEILLALKLQKPLFLIGGLGGLTKSVIDLFSEETVPIQFKLDFFVQYNPAYVNFLKRFNQHPWIVAENGQVDFTSIQKQIQATFPAGDYTVLNNGLTKEENEVLFETKDVNTILKLIFKGLKKLK